MIEFLYNFYYVKHSTMDNYELVDWWCIEHNCVSKRLNVPNEKQ